MVYPYYDQIAMGQIAEKVKVYHLVNGYFSDTAIKMGYMSFRSVKADILDFVMTYGAAVWVYVIFQNRFEEGFSWIRKSTLFLAAALGVYAVPEILLFKMQWTPAEDFLSLVNPFLYDVKTFQGWYPPVVWQNQQLRSYCIEPSLMGFICAAIFPFLYSYFDQLKKTGAFYAYSLYLCYYAMIVFMSKSRTSMVAIFFALCSLVPLWYIHKNMKQVMTVLLCMGAGFLFSVFSVDIHKDSEQSVSNEISTYYSENISTITSDNARSNGSRKINILSHLNVVSDHILMGTGTGMKDVYVRDHLVDGALDNGEIRNLTEAISTKGIAKASYGNVNHYVYILTNEGVVGLILYLFSFLYVIIVAVRKKILCHFSLLIVILSMIGSLLIAI